MTLDAVIDQETLDEIVQYEAKRAEYIPIPRHGPKSHIFYSYHGVTISVPDIGVVCSRWAFDKRPGYLDRQLESLTRYYNFISDYMNCVVKDLAKPLEGAKQIPEYLATIARTSSPLLISTAETLAAIARYPLRWSWKPALEEAAQRIPEFKATEEAFEYGRTVLIDTQQRNHLVSYVENKLSQCIHLTSKIRDVYSSLINLHHDLIEKGEVMLQTLFPARDVA